MGATANRAWPWPAGTADAGDADDHIRALAEALDTWNPVQRARCTAATAHSTVAATAITGFPAMALKAGLYYHLRAAIFYTAALATTGPRPQLVAAGGLTVVDFHRFHGTNYLAGNTVEAQSTSALGTQLAFTASVVAGTLLELEAILKVGVAGTLQLQMASEVAASAINSQAGSWVTLQEVTAA